MYDVSRLDKFERIAYDSQLAVCILGNPATKKFVLIDINPDCPRPVDLEQAIAAYGLFFIGVIGIANGVPRTALAEPLDNVAVNELSQGFLAYSEARLNECLKPVDDSEQWLWRLWSLKDPRSVADA